VAEATNDVVFYFAKTLMMLNWLNVFLIKSSLAESPNKTPSTTSYNLA
jgi:hypothetical protein